MNPQLQAWLFRIFGRERHISPKDCVHYCGFRYGTSRFNPYQNYIEGLVRGEDSKTVRQRFVEFLRHYRPEHFGEALGVNLSRKYPLWLYPWGRRSGSGGWHSMPEECPDVLTHFSRQGISNKKIEIEFRWLETALTSIQTYGFRPERFNSFILARKLERVGGDSVYLILDGNHRISVLGTLGIAELPVRYLQISTVYEADIEKWPYVRNGTYTREDARLVFQGYFHGNSTGRTTDQPAALSPPTDYL